MCLVWILGCVEGWWSDGRGEWLQQSSNFPRNIPTKTIIGSEFSQPKVPNWRPHKLATHNAHRQCACASFLLVTDIPKYTYKHCPCMYTILRQHALGMQHH